MSLKGYTSINCELWIILGSIAPQVWSPKRRNSIQIIRSQCVRWSHCETVKLWNFDSILLLASFHHLESRAERIQVLEDMKSLIAPGWAIYMTNWNLRDQPKYASSHRWDGDYDIKIGEYSRYYHGFTTDELAELFAVTGWQIIENRVFEGGRNIYSKITL